VFDEDLARLSHLLREPDRLLILAVLAEVDEADLSFLSHHTGLDGDALASHLHALQEAGFVFTHKVPGSRGERTVAALTNLGRDIFAAYWKSLHRLERRLAV
jgi:DNA-binding MarR family transcriptional regulator